MKRSKLNEILKQSIEFIQTNNFFLPPFAYWTLEDWIKLAKDAREIVECQLGWDITDFSSDNFEKYGLVLFTLRNGRPKKINSFTSKNYAEKVMVVKVDQVTPLHFHWTKMEDIINRGGGHLMIQIHDSDEMDQPTDNTSVVSIDGIQRKVAPNDIVELTPGESITLPPHLYHKFWGAHNTVLVGEISIVNDDHTDNHFYQPVDRFPNILEDEPPMHLLVSDYTRFLPELLKGKG
jgi:D-lyxose ketol-isomerase